MAGLLPLLIALLTAHAASLAYEGKDLQARPSILLLIAGTLLAWALLSCACTELLRRSPRRILIHVWDLMAHGIILAGNAWFCLAWGWPAVSSSSLLLLSPVILALLLHWQGMARAQRAPVGPSLMLRLRLVLLPACLLIGLVDLLHLLLDLLLQADWWQTGGGLLLGSLLSLALPLLILIFLPPLLLRLWGARSIRDAQLQQRLRESCACMGVRVRSILIWPMRGLPFYNAALLGLFPRWRFILLSEDLLRDLPEQQVQAVVGHELGHARHGHLWLYLIFLAASASWAILVAGGLQYVLPWELLDWQQALLWVAVWAGILRIGFGMLSRACERQADLAGASLVGDPQQMAAALASVCRLTGSSPDEPNWRHHSIAQRCSFLSRLEEHPHLVYSHHRYVMNLRLIILLLLVIGLSLTFFTPSRAPALQRLREQDSALDLALNEAQEGQATALHRWLVQQSNNQRVILARALRSHLSQAEMLEDERLLYAHRHWLLPFVDISSGNEGMDLWLDNAIAYILVAGTADPSPEEKAIAQQLLPRLSQAAQNLESASIWDTVGCVHFVLGDREAALHAFQQAQQLLQLQEDEASQALLRIVNARARAASDPDADLPRIWGQEGQITHEGFSISPVEEE